MTSSINQNYSILAKEIVTRYVDSISGKLLDDTFVSQNPSESVMIGKLAANRATKSLEKGYLENKSNQFTSIPSINVSFRIKNKNNGILHFIPRGLLFYTIQPDYEKTLRFVLDKYSEKNSRKIESISELVGSLSDKIRIPSTFKKVEIEKYMDGGISINIGSINEGTFSLQEQLSTKLSILEKKISDEIKICKNPSVQLSCFSSKESFENVIVTKDESVNAHWAIDILVSVEKESDYITFSLQMVNNTTRETTEEDGYLTELFDAGLTIIGENVEFVPFQLDYFKSNFKRKDMIYAICENISADFYPSTNSIRTSNVPFYYQYRLKTKDDFNSFTSFRALIENPIGNLSHILDEMQNDYNVCKTEFDSTRFQSLTAKNQYSAALSDYHDEIERFRKGIEQIKYKDFVKKSFAAMNKTFATKLNDNQRSAYTGWRLFQIVFIVSLIPEVIVSEYKDDSELHEIDDHVADLLYFPTGGGKTEAFLGICVFTMFFDRFRGKYKGITAFLKYPLRLLAVQQLDRVLTIVTKANVVRLSIPELKTTNRFEVGFYVGKENTPNEIKKDERLSSRNEYSNQSNESLLEANTETLDEWYRFIDTCPVCRKKSVHVRFNKTNWKLEHYCANPNCTAQTDVLPLLIVDSEIYRYLPSIVVSTIDKMAMIGINPDFKSLFGQVKTYCSLHGFSITDKCKCANCSSSLQKVQMLKDPVPTLFIQDELHLVKESLGTFDSHYESFINYYTGSLLPKEQRKSIRYIGATATISLFQNHIQELYHMNGRRFPCEYPSSTTGKDFYSYTDKSDLSRIIIGFAPYGKSITDGMWQSVYAMRLIIYSFIKNSELEYSNLKKKGFDGSLEDFSKMLLNYWIELVYNNRKQDATELENAFQNQGNNYLQSRSIPLFKIESMTSDVDFQSVRKTLFDIQSNHEDLNSTNLILATSTISHGVDEESFNSMYFFGMPGNNAEYIQAYSRVGRKYTGIVVDIIRLMRIRDRSYLKNFIQFHKNKDDMVESVPINRWARNAIYSTLPGLIAAILYQYYYQFTNGSGLMIASNLKRALNDNEIDIDDVASKLVSAYGCNPGEKMSEIYKTIIIEETATILSGIKNGTISDNSFTSDVIGQYSHWNKKPMRSLRDTDEQIEIDLRKDF